MRLGYSLVSLPPGAFNGLKRFSAPRGRLSPLFQLCICVCVSEDDRERERERDHGCILCVFLCTCSKFSPGLVRGCLYDPKKERLMWKPAALRWSTNPDGFSSHRCSINCLPSLFLSLFVHHSLRSFTSCSFWSEDSRKSLYNKVAICLRHPAERTNRKKDVGDGGGREWQMRSLLSLNFRGKVSWVNKKPVG